MSLVIDYLRKWPWRRFVVQMQQPNAKANHHVQNKAVSKKNNDDDENIKKKNKKKQ